MFIDQPYVTDVELSSALSEYNEHGFEDIPQWMQTELKVRNLPEFKRHPTEQEKEETMSDARRHRISNNEKTIEDFKDKYLRGIPFTEL